MRSEQLNKKEIKNILESLLDIVELEDLPKKGNYQRVFFDRYNLIFLNKSPVFIEYDGKYLPNIRIIKKVLKNWVKVDMGALKFLINGADVMAPGIVDYDSSIKKGDVVFVLDEKNNKVICVGVALVDLKPERGKVIKNVHYVGDEIWKNALI